MAILFRKILLSLTFCWISVLTVTAANKTYTVEGQIKFQELGDIYIYLVDKKQFQSPLTGIQLIKISKQEISTKKGVKNFKFEDVKTGTYGIRCFMDLNGNGKLDRGLFGPSEPWDMSWISKRTLKWPQFSNISFEVNSEINNLVLTLSN